MTKKREFDPIKGFWPDPESIMCKDCIFRDRAEIDLGSKKIKCGITRAECEIYQKPNYKPNAILFQKEKCEYYVKDNKN